MNKYLKNDYAWNTIGSFAQNAISPLLIVAITRINGIHDSGLFSFAFSVSIIFWAIGMWGGRTYQVSDTKGEYTHTSYISLRLILAAAMLIGAYIFSAVNSYDPFKTALIMFLVVFKALESVADPFYGIMQVHNRLYLVGRSLVYKAILGFIVFVVIDILTKDILLSCFGLICVHFLYLIFYDLRQTRKIEEVSTLLRYTKQSLRNAIRIMKRTLPVFAVFFLAMFSLNIPRYFIDKYYPDELGYFGIIAMPITLIVLLVTSVLQPKILSLAKLYNKQKFFALNKMINDILLIISLLGVTIMIATFLIGTQALQVIFGINFSEYKSALAIIVLGGIFNAVVTVFINILIVMRHIAVPLYILVLTNIILALACIWIIKDQGVLGSTGLYAIVCIVQALLFYMTYKYILRKKFYAT